jgi:hypothetical protein
MRRKRRDDYLDGRITERSVILFRLAKTMMAQGFSFDASDSPPVPLRRPSTDPDFGEYKTLVQVSRDLDRELRIKPWQPSVLDFEVYTMKAASFQPHAEFHVIEDLHRRLVAAPGG